jgi:predicted alpha/beta hydrolase
VVRGQRLTQAASDPFLGWTDGSGSSGSAAKYYYVRQLRDMKGSMTVPLMDPLQLDYYGRLCGWALARAHARTGRATLISGYLGTGDDFEQAIADFAVSYADQNERDYRRLLEAISSGRVLAAMGQ